MKTTSTLICILLVFQYIHCAKGQDIKKLPLNSYRPKSLYSFPITHISKARFPVIDIHSHDYASTRKDIIDWLKVMDSCNIEKTIILTMATGSRFDSIYHLYSDVSDRFEIWCGFDYTGYDQPGYGPDAVKELERCYKTGAKGVGELGDKGVGELYSLPIPGKNLHLDDPRMKPLFDKCAELNIPVNIHIAEPIWMYQPADSTNDGLMNSYDWKIDLSRPEILSFDQLIETLENTVKNNPNTKFIACHFANLMHDLDQLGAMLDKYPNLYADISARYAETATIPRFMKHFYSRYQDRLLYGTDMGMDKSMYRSTFRILESADEHFYYTDLFNYHWPLHGFALENDILKKLYHDNAAKLLSKK
jgi:predicted TIM-barrel fold metal-dependent hydrolase